MGNIFYVYIHRKPDGEVFYVGKGRGKRAWQRKSRNRFWKYLVAKHGYTVEIVEDNLPEAQSFELEEFLISFYGRRETGGTLVNLTDGGEGMSGNVQSLETKTKRGIAIRDKTIYTLVNFYTGEQFTGTKHAFTDEYSICLNNLLHAKHTLTAKGWCLLEDIDKIKNPKYDCRLHTFVHVSGEIIVATRDDFRSKTGINTSDIFGARKNLSNSTQGWALEENAEKIKVCAQHDKVYNFENIDGTIIRATRKEFKARTGVNTAPLFGTRKGVFNSTQGWCLEGNSEKIRILPPRRAVYTFVNVSGEIITTTPPGFKARTGTDPSTLFRKIKKATTTRTGWSLAPNQP